MMIPLAMAVFDAGNTIQTVTEPDYGGKPTAEQKRKRIKEVMMKEGPRPKQVTLVVLIWVVSVFLALERLLNTQPESRNPPVREYNIQTSENSSQETAISRNVDMTYCSVWNDNISPADIIFWIILVAIPVIFGPILTSLLELLSYVKKKYSKAPHPDTPSLIRSWIIVILSAVIVLGTYSTNLLLAEMYMKEYFEWNYFKLLMVKYFLGSIDIMLIPLVVVLIDTQLRQGLVVIFYAKKRGTLSKATSVSTNF